MKPESICSTIDATWRELRFSLKLVGDYRWRPATPQSQPTRAPRPCNAVSEQERPQQANSRGNRVPNETGLQRRSGVRVRVVNNGNAQLLWEPM